MSLATIRTEVRRYSDKVLNFSTDNLDAAVNNYYLTCWKELDKVAEHLTRTTGTLALVADQTDDYTLSFTPLVILDVQPPHANRNERTFIRMVDGMEFRRNENQRIIAYAQRSATTFTIRPAIDAALTVTIHYVRRPPVITASVDPLHFSDETLAAGAIGLLFESINFPDARQWLDERTKTGIAYTRLRDDLAIFAKLGINSDLQGYERDFPYGEGAMGNWPYGGRPGTT